MAGRIIRTGFPGIYSGRVLERLVIGLAESLGAGDADEALVPLDPVRDLPPLFSAP